MHQNLLNAEFVSALYLGDKNENVRENGVIEPLPKVPESFRDFAAHMPAMDCIFGVIMRGVADE